MSLQHLAASILLPSQASIDHMHEDGRDASGHPVDAQGTYDEPAI
jgi:hypothetical protein